MDLGLERDWFGSFMRYQRRLRAEFRKLQSRFGLESVNANGSIPAVQAELKERIRRVLLALYPNHEIS
jgi:hypothetical protein